MTDATRIRALVVDDEPLAREMIREMLENDSEVEIVGECANGRETVEAIQSTAPDIVFLDIQMPELGGFEVLESLEPKATPYVIFVTAYDQYAVRAFEVHALDYLLKPYDRERFEAAWQRAKEQLKLDRASRRDQDIIALLEELKAGPRYLERLVIKNGGRVFFLHVQDVYCIEAEGNYVRVYDGQKGYLLRETISSLEEQLDPKQFLRIHRSAIVKIDRIKEMQPWFHGEYRIIMENGKQLALSRNYRANLQEAVGNTL
ncbi:MAG TPA: LytTR family transcriptional regulator DNA-binding domain-containing protein [Pyrinomonadaceae bacterium]|nr:LytTR family transcriptional regulator DNA-binding domain-containing protein [Pyrinomonadaceae bacterium]